jgi:hypothetical protein
LTPRIDRRSFLALGVGAVAWACSRGGKDDAVDTADPGADKYSVVATAVQGLAIGDTRQGLAVFRGQNPVAVRGLRVRLVPPGGEPFAVEAQHVQIKRGPGGDSKRENTEVGDVYVVRHDFDRSGVWGLDVRFTGGAGQAAFQILDDVPSPKVGDKAIASQSPTTDDPRGVDPICTRTPPCSLHDLSIAEALDRGKPSVIVFGTPRYCTSRTCGPVVDVVEHAKDSIGSDASFIHIEQWKSDKTVGKAPDGLAPTFREWKLDTEPWIYFVDAKGVVKDRWLGAVGDSEIVRATQALIKA